MALIEEVLVLLELVFIVIVVARVGLATILASNVLIGVLGLGVVVTAWVPRLARWHQGSFLFIVVLGK